MKLNKVVIVSKFGSKISEDAAKQVAKKLLSKKIDVYTIAPVEVDNAKQVESLDKLSKIKLDWKSFPTDTNYAELALRCPMQICPLQSPLARWKIRYAR